MKIIGFSGPPHSGKDSIADALTCLMNDRMGWPYPAVKRSLAAPMRRVGMTLLGWDPLDDAAYVRLKEEPQILFKREFKNNGIIVETEHDNLRQFMICFSEAFIKLHYGQDFWGRLLYSEAVALGLEDAIIVIPDLGFHSEIQFFENTIGADNFVTVQLMRKGYDFSKDSRDYVSSKQLIEFHNDYTIEGAASYLLGEIKVRFGWQL